MLTFKFDTLVFGNDSVAIEYPFLFPILSITVNPSFFWFSCPIPVLILISSFLIINVFGIRNDECIDVIELAILDRDFCEWNESVSYVTLYSSIG